jgi:protein-disulfide isomerase
MIPKSGNRFSDQIMRQQTPTEPQLRITRREFCQSTAVAALSLALLGTSSLTLFPSQALAQTVPMSDLLKPHTLPDMVMGDDKAPVTIIEYASMTCPHCAHFQETTFPELKKRYIDTGKVRYISREFPLDSLAAAAFMLARCAGQDDKTKYFALVDTLYRQQRTWAVEKPLAPLFAIAKQAGFTQQTFDACLSNQKILDGLESVRDRAAQQFKVESTPTFFINGTKVSGSVSIEEMAKLIDPQVKG